MNPYQGPNDPSALKPPTSVSDAKPATIAVFGTLNLAFAAMGLCGVLVSLGIRFVPQGANTQVKNPVVDLMNNNAAYQAFMIGGTVLGFIFIIVLAIGGIGLLQTRRYGRKCSIVYGWYGIIAAVGSSVAHAFFFLPLLQDVDKLQGPDQAAVIGGIAGGVLGGCFGLIYPAILLFFMYRPYVDAALKD